MTRQIYIFYTFNVDELELKNFLCGCDIPKFFPLN